MISSAKYNPRFRHSAPAFTRLDLIVFLSAAALLLGWTGFALTGERQRIARCTGNLKTLGRTMQEYANDHADGIPIAVIDLNRQRVAWDADLLTYLEPTLANSPGAYAKRTLVNEAGRMLACPSDRIPRGHPRSYLMPANDMTAANWPPGADSATGVGLMWNRQTAANLLPADEAPKALEDFNRLPKVKFSDLPAAADTLLLTELIVKENTVKGTAPARVTFAGQRQSQTNGELADFHFGKFNYLMTDGHVELLSPAQTGNAGLLDADHPSGIWTIKAGD